MPAPETTQPQGQQMAIPATQSTTEEPVCQSLTCLLKSLLCQAAVNVYPLTARRQGHDR
jgi:hypothetical protein